MKYPQTVVVGAGNIAQTVHLPLLKKLGVPIVQIIDPSAEARKKAKSFFQEAESSTSLTSLLPNARCAVITSPSNLHAEQIRILLDKGLDILCEKPLATTGSDARHLLEHAATQKRVLQVGYYRRYHEAAQYVHSLLQSGAAGKPLRCCVLAGALMNSLPASFFDHTLSGGGMTMDFGVHVLDMLQQWFQQLRLVSYADDAPGNIEANAVIQLSATLNNLEVPITTAVSRTTPLGFVALVEFERGIVRYELNTGHCVEILHLEQKLDGASKEISSSVKQLGAPAEASEYFERQWQEFVERINGGKEIVSNLNDAVTISALAEECYRTRRPLFFSWEELFTHNTTRS